MVLDLGRSFGSQGSEFWIRGGVVDLVVQFGILSTVVDLGREFEISRRVLDLSFGSFGSRVLDLCLTLSQHAANPA